MGEWAMVKRGLGALCVHTAECVTSDGCTMLCLLPRSWLPVFLWVTFPRPLVGSWANIYICMYVFFKAIYDNKLWKILKEMGLPDHLTCLLRKLYAGQEATIRTGHGTTDWFQIGKGVCQSCILSPCLFNLYAEYMMRNTGLEEA